MNPFTATTIEAQLEQIGLWQEYARKPVRQFYQYDRFGFAPGLDEGPLWASYTSELRNTNCVRVTVPFGTDPGDAVDWLREIADWIERDGLRPDISDSDPSPF